jgi:5-methylcytosine-specific restriction enzyme A
VGSIGLGCALESTINDWHRQQIVSANTGARHTAGQINICWKPSAPIPGASLRLRCAFPHGAATDVCASPADDRLSHGRSRPTDKWDKWYSTARWARIRRHQLLEHPLCKYCAERGIVEPATICDHVEPHRGDVNKFWLGPFQSLCKSCHNSTKRFVEARGFRPDIDLDRLAIGPAPSGLQSRAVISRAWLCWQIK